MTGPATRQEHGDAVSRLLEQALGRPVRKPEQEMIDLVPPDTVALADWAAAVGRGSGTFEDLVSAAFICALERRRSDGTQSA